VAGVPLTKTLGSTVYTITPFGARKGLRVSFLVSRMMAGVVGLLASGDVRGAVEAWSANASVEDFETICKELESCTTFEMPITEGGATQTLELSKFFDSHFVGKYDEMTLWLVEALRVNFASFFSGPAGSAVALKLKAMMAVAAASSSPKG
jgi:hypothetical protein